MKNLLIKTFCLLIFPISVIASILFLLPVSESFKKKLVFTLIDKNKSLKEINNPRIIFIGGSNLSFGIDSKRIKDSLNLIPINTGIHADIGLKFMLSNVENYIRKNDIIIVSPEYQQFYGNLANGSTELLSIILDVSPNSKSLLDYKQYYSLISVVPKYSLSKCYGYIDINTTDTIIDIYDRKAFNSFGDAYLHWNLPKKKVAPYGKMEGNINNDVILSLLKFKNIAYKKGAKLYITFPGYQDLSYNNSEKEIIAIEQNLKQNGFNLLSSPERYIIPDTLTFDTPYHLTKKGIDFRTTLLIEDLQKVI